MIPGDHQTHVIKKHYFFYTGAWLHYSKRLLVYSSAKVQTFNGRKRRIYWVCSFSLVGLSPTGLTCN